MSAATPATTARKYARYPIRLPTFLIRGTKSTQLYSRDVSFGGLFLHTNLPPPLRELMRIRMVLPPNQEEVNLLGMAVHRVEPGSPRSPGIGIKLYGNDPKTSRRWDAFIHYVREHSNNARDYSEDIGESSEWPKALEAQRAVRARAIRVRIPTVEDLWTIADRDLARGQTTICTEMYFEPGTTVKLELVHPQSKKTFGIRATVQNPFRRGPMTGLALDLEVDDRVQSRFREFLDDEFHISLDLGPFAEPP